MLMQIYVLSWKFHNFMRILFYAWQKKVLAYN